MLQDCNTVCPSKPGPPLRELKQHLEFSFMCMIIVIIIISKITK